MCLRLIPFHFSAIVMFSFVFKILFNVHVSCLFAYFIYLFIFAVFFLFYCVFMILFIYLFSSQNPRNIYIFSESKIEKENHHMIDYIKLQKHREEWWALKHRHKLFILLLMYTNIPCWNVYSLRIWSATACRANFPKMFSLTSQEG